MKRAILLLLLLLAAFACKKTPPTPKTNPDMGTQGGATQIDTETH